MAITQTLSEGLKREFEVIITNSELNKLVDEKLNNIVNAGVAKLVDAQDLGSCIERCGGSSPFARTIIKKFLLLKR